MFANVPFSIGTVRLPVSHIVRTRVAIGRKPTTEPAYKLAPRVCNPRHTQVMQTTPLGVSAPPCHAPGCSRPAVSACGSCQVALVCSRACQTRMHASVLAGGAEHGTYCAALGAFASAHPEHGIPAAREGYGDWLASGMPGGMDSEEDDGGPDPNRARAMPPDRKRKAESAEDDDSMAEGVPDQKRTPTVQPAEKRKAERAGPGAGAEADGEPSAKRPRVEQPASPFDTLFPEIMDRIRRGLTAREIAHLSEADRTQYDARGGNFTEVIAQHIAAIPPEDRIITAYAPEAAQPNGNAHLYHFNNMHNYARAIVNKEGLAPWTGPPTDAQVGAGKLLSDMEQGGTTYVARFDNTINAMAYGTLLPGTDWDPSTGPLPNTYRPTPWTTDMDGRQIISLRGNLIIDRVGARQLPELEVVSGNILVVGLSQDGGDTAMDRPLQSLWYVGGDLKMITCNFTGGWFHAISRISGDAAFVMSVGTGQIFPLLTEIVGVLIVDGGDGDEGIEWPGIFPNLMSVGGLRLEEVTLHATFPSLTSVKRELELRSVVGFGGTSLFGALEDVGGDLRMHGIGNSYLDNDFTSLVRVGGTIQVGSQANGMPLPAFESLQSVGALELQSCAPSEGENGHDAYFPALKTIGTQAKGGSCIIDLFGASTTIPASMFAVLHTIHGNVECTHMELGPTTHLFPHLRKVTGTIDWSEMPPLGDTTCRSLETCFGLTIHKNALDGIPIFSNLGEVDGTIELHAIAQCTGHTVPVAGRDIFPNLKRISGSVLLTRVYAMDEADQLIPLSWMGSLSVVGEDIALDDVRSTRLQLFQSLTNIAGNLSLNGCMGIATHHTLPSLRAVGGNMTIDETGQLLQEGQLDSLLFISSLQTIGGDFTIRYCGRLIGLTGTDTLQVNGTLTIYETPRLSRLSNISVSGKISIGS